MYLEHLSRTHKLTIQICYLEVLPLLGTSNIVQADDDQISIKYFTRWSGKLSNLKTQIASYLKNAFHLF